MQGSASDVCCGHTFARNGRYQTKNLPSLICSSNLLVWQLSPQEVKGLYVSQRGVGFIHSLTHVSALKCCQWLCCLQRPKVFSCPLRSQPHHLLAFRCGSLALSAVPGMQELPNFNYKICKSFPESVPS